MNKILIVGLRISASALAKKIAEDNPFVIVDLIGLRIEGNIPSNLRYLGDMPNSYSILSKMKNIYKDYDFIYAADLHFQFNVRFQEWRKTIDVPVLCPSRECCFLEFSKLSFKKILNELNIPNPEHEIISEDEWGRFNPLTNDKFSSGKFILKMDKVAVSNGTQTCITDISNYMDKIYTSRHLCETFFAEEYITGSELSAHFLCNGESFVYLGAARDYKKMYEDDIGQNCSSSGCYSPVDYLTDDIKTQAFSYVNKILKYLREKGFEYRGMMYLGLIIDSEGIVNILELNSRPGNPEFNTIVNLISSKNILINMYNAAIGEKLEQVEFSENISVSINLLNSSYPDVSPDTQLPELTPDKEITTCYFNGNSEMFANILTVSDTKSSAADKLYKYLYSHDLKSFRIRTDIGKLK
jgi:phosphoribosylamine-glycine ligase